jgi:hypothetical protein
MDAHRREQKRRGRPFIFSRPRIMLPQTTHGERSIHSLEQYSLFFFKW